MLNHFGVVEAEADENMALARGEHNVIATQLRQESLAKDLQITTLKHALAKEKSKNHRKSKSPPIPI